MKMRVLASEMKIAKVILCSQILCGWANTHRSVENQAREVRFC